MNTRALKWQLFIHWMDCCWATSSTCYRRAVFWGIRQRACNSSKLGPRQNLGVNQTFGGSVAYLYCERCEPTMSMKGFNNVNSIKLKSFSYIFRILINFVAREVVLVQREVVVVRAQREIIHLIDEIFKAWILLAGELLDLLPNFLALRVLFSFSVKWTRTIRGRARLLKFKSTYNCLSFLNLLLHSSNSLWFISINNLMAL